MMDLVNNAKQAVWRKFVSQSKFEIDDKGYVPEPRRKEGREEIGTPLSFPVSSPSEVGKEKLWSVANLGSGRGNYLTLRTKTQKYGLKQALEVLFCRRKSAFKVLKTKKVAPLVREIEFTDVRL